MKKYLMTVLIMTTVLFAANEIHYFDIGGQSNLYVRVTRASNLQIYDTVAAELSASPDWANTDIALTQADPNLYSGLYLADMPAVPAGLYYLEAYQGTSPAKTDTKLAPWIEYWDGSAFQYISEQIVAVEADVNALNTVVARELVIYDSPTRTEATADKAEILADTTILKAGVNVSTINGEEPLTASEIVADIEAGDSLTGIKAKTDLLTFTGTDVQVTLNGEEVTTDSASREASKADVSALALEVTVQDVNDNVRGDITALNNLSESEMEVLLEAALAEISLEATLLQTEEDIINTIKIYSGH